ncbi:hypothetical protein NMY22_g2962 [Coprinellus aureogranulatus]|nr:hypothetical protein NMY22_g2962 [Coprinellus aureogranulatus]
MYTLTFLATSALLSASYTGAKPLYPHQKVVAREITTRAVSCFPLQVADASKRQSEARSCISVAGTDPLSHHQVPAWHKVTEYLDKTYGKGYDTLHFNDAQLRFPFASLLSLMYLSIPLSLSEEAGLCADEPRCSTSKAEIQGNVDGTNQTVSFLEKIGTEQKTSWTITKESTVGFGVEFSLGFEIPKIGSGGVSVHVDAEFKNTRSDSFETTSTNMRETKFEFVNRDGQQCKFEIESQSCTATATGTAPVIAKGQLLAKYPNRRQSAENADYGEHYHWFVNLEDVLTEEERTSWIEFQGPVSVSSNAAYQTDCAPVTDVCAAPVVAGTVKAQGVPV